MRKFKPNFSSFLLSATIAVSLMATNAHAASYRYDNAYQEFRPFASDAPKFSGVFASLGVGYNMLPGVAYTDTFTPAGLLSSNVNATSSATNYISGLIKLGYAYRIGKKGYLGIAGFYNLSSLQTSLNTTYQYAQDATNPVQISNEVQQSPGYGVILMPGVLLTPYSLLYANVGVQMNTVKFSSQQTDVDPSVAAPLSVSKSAMTYLIGIGYQHQINLTKSPKARNLMWFTELNYGLGTVSVNQTYAPADPSVLSPGRAETYSVTPNALQLAVGISYYF